MSRNIFDWYLCITSILDEEAQPHSSVPFGTFVSEFCPCFC